jgi:hypothetical protein
LVLKRISSGKDAWENKIMKNLKYGLIMVVLLFLAVMGFMGCKRGGKMEQIGVTPATATIAPGTTLQFSSQAYFSNGDVYDWTATTTWNSSDAAAVTVSNTLGAYGLATSLVTGPTSTGTFIITATDTANSISGTAMLTVKDPISISISPANPFMAINTSHQFSATALLEDVVSGGTTTITQDLTSSPTLNWIVSDPTIATISSTGLVTTGATPGSTTIKAYQIYSSSTPTATTTLTVTNSPLISILVTSVTQTITQGTQQPYTAQGTFQDTTTSDLTSSVTWDSSNTRAATISNTAGTNGLATALSTGATSTATATIRATDPITGISNSTTLYVTP